MGSQPWPDTASEEFGRLAPRITKLIQAWMERGEQPGTRVAPWRTAAEYQEAMELALPTEPTDEDRVVQEVASILDNSVNPWTHRFLAKLYTAPLVPSVVGDLLLGALNASVHVFSASPMLSLMEQTCVSGLCKLLQLGPDADGVSMPGGASSNTLAVQTALCQVAGGVYRTDGVLGLVRALEAQGRRGQGARPVLLAGASCHFSISHAALAAGLGTDAVVSVPVDEHGRMRVDALAAYMDEMRADPEHPRGCPVMVCATSGTTVLGAFDDIAAIAEVCGRHGIWLHADASWGGGIAFTPAAPTYLQGVHRADSVTINPHKLLRVTHQCSFLLLRDRRQWVGAPKHAGYLYHADAGATDLATKTLGCGRRGEALKLYLVWLRYGTYGLGAQLTEALGLAQRVRDTIRTKPSLELGPQADPPFLQVCFRPQRAAAHATRQLHAALADAQMYAVDFAPWAGEEYLRLVVHPGTPWPVLAGLLDAAAEAAAAW